jgi:hypothetical protein
MLHAYKIPITIGVVGHLDAITTDEHKIQIENLFKDLASGYPNSPVYLFSSIAEGADRFVANILLDLKKREEYSERFELIVPTPFEPDEYKNDFDDNSDKEFDNLVKQAKRSFCICPEGKRIDRPQQYLKTGKFVADSSLILIALWDGEEGKKGGTADIVNYKRSGDDDNVAESTFEYDGTVFILPCNRRGSADQVLNDQGKKIELSLELVLQDASIREALDKIEEINTDSLKPSQSDFARSESYLMNDNDKPEASQRFILGLYSILDVLSIRFQKSDMNTAKRLFAVGLLLVMTLEIYTNLWLNKLVLGVAMVFIVIAIMVYFNSRLKKNHKKYLYNRTLAEALRIQFYWNFAGINKNVSDYILRIHRKEFTWIKHILSSVYGVTYIKSSITTSVINDLTNNWVKNQADFFESSIKKMNRKLGRYHLVSNLSFIIAFTLLLSIFFLEKFYEAQNMLNWVIVIIGSLLGLFAMIKAFIKMKGYDQLLNQYELMNVIYQRAEAKIIEINATIQDTFEKHSYLKALFFIIGKEALIENGNWYLIFKEKEPEIEGI